MEFSPFFLSEISVYVFSRLAGQGAAVEYKPLASGPNAATEKMDNKETEVRIEGSSYGHSEFRI